MRYVLPFTAISAADLPRVGGKGANLGELARAGFPVPPGFCLTAAAFRRFMAACPTADRLYDALDSVDAGDVDAARRTGQQVREALQSVPLPNDIAQAICRAWQEAGPDHAYAVRSSATAEDLPDASFAGQQDTFLNVRGEADLLASVKKCWISLFTDRAILYRAKNEFDHRDVALAVVVQRMVRPDVSGILFTADPVTNHRYIASIDASFGLGEALVAGLVSADQVKVDKRTLQVVEVEVADKKLAIRPLADGGTTRESLSDDQRHARALPDEQAMLLAEIGNRIEAHYGRPQDIEWAIENDRIRILQSRPITTLFPLPQPQPQDDDLHVYASFGHAQVMTDPMPPLAISVWRVLFPFGKNDPGSENPYLCAAGNRIYIDVSPLLRQPLLRRVIPRFLQVAEQLIARAVQQVVARPAFQAGEPARLARIMSWLLPLMLRLQKAVWREQPEGTSERLTRQTDHYVSQVLQQREQARPGIERLRAMQDVLGRVFVEAAWTMPHYIAAGVVARALLERLLPDQRETINALLRGLEGNVTTEMDLAVADLADVARQSPALVAALREDPAVVVETAESVAGAQPFLTALDHFLDCYGARSPSEIDISRPRWRDDPTSLLRMVAGNLDNTESGAHRRQHAQRVREGKAAAEQLVTAARRGPLGWLRGRIVGRLVRAARHYLPAREHPKFLLVQVLALVRDVVVETAAWLHQQKRIDQLNDVWFLTLPELIAALETPNDELRSRIETRRAEFRRAHKQTPPRVITSDGEIITAQYDGDLPDGALPGSPVSAGVVEGVARVITDPSRQSLHPGEILVAPFTDPGWTPLFVNAAGLVMEVGGLMTHGSVVAREYGIPAVVGVVEATQWIETGQRLRVNGDAGYVEILTTTANEGING